MTFRAADRPAQDSPPDVVIRTLFIGDAVTNAGYAVLVADENMRYLAATDGACELLGYSCEELVGMAVSAVVVETNAPNLYEQFVRDRAQRGTITLRRKDGSHVSAAYDARETLVSHMPYYVSWLTPLNG
jgi:PAS domain S-box-containing protein